MLQPPIKACMKPSLFPKYSLYTPLTAFSLCLNAWYNPFARVSSEKIAFAALIFVWSPFVPTEFGEHECRFCICHSFRTWYWVVAAWWRICLPVQGTWVQSLGCKDPLEQERATHLRILAWGIPWTEEPGGLQSPGSERVEHDWVTNTHRGNRHVK